jgi:hypothetical protein
VFYTFGFPCHSSGGQLPAFHCGGPGSSPGQITWDLFWTKWYLGRFSPSTSVSPCQFSFHQLLHIGHHLSFGAGTVGQLMADVPSGPSLTPSTRGQRPLPTRPERDSNPITVFERSKIAHATGGSHCDRPVKCYPRNSDDHKCTTYNNMGHISLEFVNNI